MQFHCLDVSIVWVPEKKKGFLNIEAVLNAMKQRHLTWPYVSGEPAPGSCSLSRTLMGWGDREQVTVHTFPSPGFIVACLPSPDSVSKTQPGAEVHSWRWPQGSGICSYPRIRGPGGQDNQRYVSRRWCLDHLEAWLSMFLQAEAGCSSHTVIIILLETEMVQKYVHVLFWCLGSQVWLGGSFSSFWGPQH